MKNKLKNLFVPYELAYNAKQNGFNELCFGYFDETKSEAFGKPSVTNNGGYDNSEYGGVESELIAAPIHQQLIDWLEEKYKIIISRDLDVDDDFAFNIILGRIDKYSYDEDKIKALNGAIKEAFKLIKK